MKVISFYMNEQTERSAQQLARSCDKYGLVHEFESIPDHGSYHLNRLHVPSWILWKLLDNSQEDVIWMNSTATILEDPVLLRKPQGDMAAFKMGPAYWAKTMFVRNCDVSRKTLRRWADLNLEFPDRISCENFSQAVLELKPTVTILPPTYSWLPTFDKTYKSQKPVILHPMEGL
jgi:hypothetical protein